MSDYKIFSADSHVSEPGDLWVERIDKEFRFRAPRLERRERNGRMEDLWVYEGFPPTPSALASAPPRAPARATTPSGRRARAMRTPSPAAGILPPASGTWT